MTHMSNNETIVYEALQREGYGNDLGAVVSLRGEHGSQGADAVVALTADTDMLTGDAVNETIARYKGHFGDLAEFAADHFGGELDDSTAHMKSNQAFQVVFSDRVDWNGVGEDLQDQQLIRAIESDSGVHVWDTTE